MTDADIKALNLILDHITKIIVAQTQKILAEVGKRNRGPKPVATSIKLQRARNELAKSRAENRALHKLLEQEVNKIQSK
jgi:hypothetical protein